MCSTARKNPNRGANAKGNQGSKWISKAARLAIYIRDGFSCAYCGADLRDAARDEITLDHLDPRCTTLTAAERRDPRRLVTACRRCNSQRQDKPWTQYATGGAIDRIRRQVRRSLNIDLARALLAGRAGNPELEAR
jgi:5-methylcytosine-specific restriction endonuclease McrA